MHKITPARKEEIEFEVNEGDTSDYWRYGGLCNEAVISIDSIG